MVYPSDILNEFVMRLEKGESKHESSYKPPTNTGNGENKRSSVDEKEKLDRALEDPDDKAVEDKENDANKTRSENRNSDTDKEEDELVMEILFFIW